MKKVLALCLIVCLSLSLSPFRSVAEAGERWESLVGWGLGVLSTSYIAVNYIIPSLYASEFAELCRKERVTKDLLKDVLRLIIEYLQKPPDERADYLGRNQACLRQKYPEYAAGSPTPYPPDEIASQFQAVLQKTLPAQAGQIAKEFYAHRCATPAGAHFIEQNERNRKYFIACVQRYFRDSKNFEHIQRLDIDHFARAICGRILRSPSVRAEYENFLRDQIIKLPERQLLPIAIAFFNPQTLGDRIQATVVPRMLPCEAWFCTRYIKKFCNDEIAEQIALEFWNYRCEAFAGAHFVEQTDENRANVIARVKRYFRNSKNWEHIQNLDIDHFANEVLGERNIPRLPAVRAEYENFLRNQILNIPKIQALKHQIQALKHPVWNFLTKHKLLGCGATLLAARLIVWAMGGG
jgi:hypothetical protein